MPPPESRQRPGELARAFRTSVLRSAFGELLQRHGADLPALTDLDDASKLVDALDRTQPFTSERDALLADLLRLHRRTGDGIALEALVYALLTTVIRRGIQGGIARDDRDESSAELQRLLVERLKAFDPNAQSRNVQAVVERNVLHRFDRWCRREGRRRARMAEVATVAGHASDDLIAGTFSLTDLVGALRSGSGGPANERDVLDEGQAEALVREFVARGLLSERDARLFGRVELLGESAVEVALAHGMKAGTVSTVVRRARARLQKKKLQVEAICCRVCRAEGL